MSNSNLSFKVDKKGFIHILRIFHLFTIDP